MICSSQPDKSIAKFALNPYPIHHPENMDLSIIHLKNETAGTYGLYLHIASLDTVISSLVFQMTTHFMDFFCLESIESYERPWCRNALSS